MNTSQIYIAISIVVLAVIALLFIVRGRSKKQNRLTPLSGLAFGFILMGIVFGGDRLTSYSLFGIGVVIAVIDIFKRSKSKVT